MTSAPSNSLRFDPIERAAFVLAICLFRLALDISYIYYMVPVFEDHFLTPMKIDVALEKYALSWLGVLLIGFITPNTKANLSGIFFLSALMFIILPITTMYGFNQSLNGRAFFLALLALITSNVASRLTFGTIQIPLAKNGNYLATGFCLGLLGVFLAWTIASGAIANINFDISKIYTLREASADVLDVGFMAYVNIWVQKVFAPFLLALALLYKRPALIFVMIFIHVYFFMVTQHRAHLFTPVLIGLVYFLYRREITITSLFVYGAFGVFAILALALLFDLGAISSVILRRALFVPASVTFDWIDYFQNRPKAYFSDNLLAEYVSGPYQGEILPRLLGDYKAEGKELAFNTGLIGAGYAQIGVWGTVFYAAILGGILRFANRLIQQGLPVFLAASILFAPLRTAWADSDLFTALLTHGVLVSICVLWLFGRLSQPHFGVSQ